MIPAQGVLSAFTRHDILEALRGFMRDADLSQAAVAKAIGTSATYINNLLTAAASIPEDTRDQLLRDINRWLDREARARDNVRPVHFVETRIASAMISVGNLLVERSDIGVVWGPAGIGKSITAEAIAGETGGVFLRIDADCATPRGFVRAVYNASGRRKHNANNRVRVEQIVERLRSPEKIASPTLVVLDEAHQLQRKTYSIIRDLFDQAKCSFLLVGTVDVAKHVDSDSDPDFGQMASRAGIKLDLMEELRSGSGGSGSRGERLFTVAEVRALCQRGKLKLHSDAARMLLAIANHDLGHLRSVERVHYHADRIAERRRADQILPAHVEAAARLCRVKLVAIPSEVEAREAATA